MKLLIRFFSCSLLFLILVSVQNWVSAEVIGRPTNLIIKQTGNSEILLSWSAVRSEGEDYSVTVTNGGIVEDSDTKDTETKISGLIVGRTYTVSVKANSIGAESSKIFTLNTYSEQSAENGGKLNPTELQTASLLNNQSMHSYYQNNTNTCANCHSTHQATSGSGLLTSSTVYETCISCHDGSLGFYNVFETDMTKDNGAGTFGGSYAGNMSVHMATGEMKISTAPGASVIESDSSIKENGKWNKEFTCTSCHNPHGSTNDRLLNSDPNGYSRIPRKLVNGVYYGGLITDEIEVIDNGGNAFIGMTAAEGYLNERIPVNETINESYKAVRVQITNEEKESLENSFRYEQVKENDLIICFFRYDKFLKKWIIAPYNQRSQLSGDGIDLLTVAKTDLKGWKEPVDAENPEQSEKVKVGFQSFGWYGYIKLPSITVAKEIKFVSNIATLLNFDLLKTDEKQNQGVTGSNIYKVDYAEFLKEQSKLGNLAVPTPEVQKVMSNLNQYNEWCASCHIGFNISSQQKESLSGTLLYSHHSSSAEDQLSCIECHYSHGTDATWMKDKDGIGFVEIFKEMEKLNVGQEFTTNTGKKLIRASTIEETKITIQDYLRDNQKDTNPTSALKRYVNTSSCYRCHGIVNPAQ